MKIQLERLPHQVAAIKAINNAFLGVDKYSDDPDANYIYANPILRGRGNEKDFIDIKMETGTGKTFVYTQMMFEMHKQGIFKFVIVVPTPSIKEGTRSFITSDYARQYFSSIPGYENVSIQLNEINAGDFKNKKGRKNFPPQLSEFIEATRQNTNQIQVLLINSGMLSANSGMHKSDFDQTLLGGETNPIKAIATTRPIIIIDEPHRFPRNKVTYKSIESMKPQLIVRFGATFPKETRGRGRNKVVKTDYYRGHPQYELNAIDSFNQGLVKGIDINYPDIPESVANNLYKVKKVTAKELTLTKKGNSKEYVIGKGENLADVDEGFSGNITYAGSKTLSNGLELSPTMQLIPGTFSENYQDEIISEAIDRHFEAEQNNFIRNGTAPRIKTLSLFFIDSIDSFRGQNHTQGWLAKHFEKLLSLKLEKLIDKYKLAVNEREKEYLDFLEATLRSLRSDNQQVYAGYFSEDRGSGDEAIQEEVDDILKNKEKLLSFKDDQGHWITRRFLFSKWTLREGWDNPNVFVIAKLRTSGSENSKIQEVGRGLRLPVDETGHRLQQDEYESRLSFLIGYDEREFAEKLVNEVNEDAPIKLDHKALTQDMMNIIVNERKITDPSFNEEKLLEDLDTHNVITRTNQFKSDVLLNGQHFSGYDALVQLYPELEQKNKVAKGKIRNKNSQVKTKIKLRKSNWNQLKKLWLQLSQRQMIKFDSDVNEIAKDIAADIFRVVDPEIFVYQKPQIVHQKVEVDEEKAIVEDSKTDYNSSYITMNYGQFLKNLAMETDLPVHFLNQQMIIAMKKLDNKDIYINEQTLKNIILNFNSRFNERIRSAYSYEPLNFHSSTSIYNAKKKEFVNEISATELGIYSCNSLPDNKYLYDRPPLRYDSADPELKILKRTYGNKITVFGKLPKKAIKIPRYDNGTSTPDFIFKIDFDNQKSKYLIVETKAKNMRIGDETIKSIQSTYFDHLRESGIYYKCATSDNEVYTSLRNIEEGKEK